LEVVTGAASGRATQVATADEFVSSMLPLVHAIRQTEAWTPEAMSQTLNQRGIRTARGGMWRVIGREPVCAGAKNTVTSAGGFIGGTLRAGERKTAEAFHLLMLE
jgi:hypothetical protein